jgi:hypothetical protein
MEYTNFIVKDVIGDNCERLFILESPHGDELQNDPPIPAVGRTGRIMSEKLGYDETHGLGNLIDKGLASKEGIINSCLFPLQSIAYKSIPIELVPFMNVKDVSLDLNCTELSKHLSTEVFEELTKSLQKRIEEAVNSFPITQIIICGKIAAAFISASIGIDCKKIKIKKVYQLSGRDVEFIWARHPTNKMFEWDCFCLKDSESA